MIEEQDRVWEELMKLLDTLAVVIGPRRLPLRVLESLFDSGAAAIRIGEIPRRWTRSSSAPPTGMPPTGIRSAYVIGASAGVFPAACGSVGLFGENERTQLISAGLQLFQTAQVQAVREKFYAYFAVTVPSERLWISWPAAGLDGGSNPPSQIITEAAALTGTEPQSPVQLAPAQVRSTVRWPWSNWLPSRFPEVSKRPAGGIGQRLLAAGTHQRCGKLPGGALRPGAGPPAVWR